MKKDFRNISIYQQGFILSVFMSILFIVGSMSNTFSVVHSYPKISTHSKNSSAMISSILRSNMINANAATGSDDYETIFTSISERNYVATQFEPEIHEISEQSIESTDMSEFYMDLYSDNPETIEINGHEIEVIPGAPAIVYDYLAEAEDIKDKAEVKEMLENPAYYASPDKFETKVVRYKQTTYYAPRGVLTPSGGVNYVGDQKETYYNLPMKRVVQNAHDRGITGEYWVRDDGCKMLGDYIMVAANQSVHPYGTLVETSLGTGIVVDTGEFAATNALQIDIAVTW